MAAALFSLLIVTLVGFGGRDQNLLTAMVTRQGRRPGLLLVALVSGVGTVALAAWAAPLIAAQMPAPAREIFAALALALAGAEMIFTRRTATPAEPTHSLGAFALVLLAGQLTDAARFAVVGLAVATNAPWPTALGGGAAAIGTALGAWLSAEELARLNLAGVRRWIGAVILAAALFVGLRAIGRI
ncbi:MAG: hypothetical protein JSR96_09015 [Proteobacteria bacterium]|nr:hypothetical protein [Pseudomonadota bacterium]